jgi:hypothetical protein
MNTTPPLPPQAEMKSEVLDWNCSRRVTFGLSPLGGPYFMFENAVHARPHSEVISGSQEQTMILATHTTTYSWRDAWSLVTH